ncbi:MAG: saccharopine dehydrogenase NADP-binding domain-containing protein [Bacteroidia bacterium]|nr:saccharopine dehydrogenase NADP-binding domain-containing protein [Bacteroidia bacterium]
MKQILLLGAGRSSGSLVHYLLQKSGEKNFRLKIGDKNPLLAEEKIKGHPNGISFAFDVEQDGQRAEVIGQADLVISMLPPALHFLVAKDCLRFRKNLVTASYVSKEIQSLHEEAQRQGLLFLNECGLDPGIDHMSAMDLILRLKNSGAELTAFRSYTGGLVAPESNDNPWGYKFTWNPRNVILAGQGTARYIQNGRYHYLPYPRLFSESVRINVEGLGRFDGYANRDSLAYRHHYGLDNIPTLIRGTLRQEGFCSAWQVFVTLGLTDDSFQVENSATMTYRQLVEAFLPPTVLGSDLEEKLAHFCRIDPEGPAMERIRSTGILDEKMIGLQEASPAGILQHLLESKWKLNEGDKDMIVMQHQLQYKIGGVEKQVFSSLVVKGEDRIHTAMAKTVGLPLGIAALKILEGQISLRGVQLPIHEEIFTPILAELEEYGIRFVETMA